MAAVALANGLNATMLRKWVTQAESEPVPALAPHSIDVASHSGERRAPDFIPIPLATAVPSACEIRIDLQRAGTILKVSWPTSAAAECAAWLRELLR